MTREISLESVPRLPRLNGATALTLGELLLKAAAATGRTLPRFVERPRLRLEAALIGLVREFAPTETENAEAVMAAEQASDDAWRSFSAWLGAMAGAPSGAYPEHGDVRGLNVLLFRGGFSVNILSYREEWTHGEIRLNALLEGGYEPMIRALGGGPFLDNLIRTHSRFGAALCVRAPLLVSESPAAKPRFDALVAAMKEYVLKVACYADLEEPGSGDLSEILLVPVVRWKQWHSQTRDNAAVRDSTSK